MNWSIDAEWYDAREYCPPNGDNVLVVRRAELCSWSEEKNEFEWKMGRCYGFGQVNNGLWFVDGDVVEQRTVEAWTWLPKLPKGMVDCDNHVCR